MQNISGFLNINKPPGCTSHDVVAILRKSTGIKKMGHSGTLDPFATGILVIGINDATRLFEYLPDDKVYLAEITFRIETDTNDITGNILSRSDIRPPKDEILEKVRLFTGKIKQKPPIFSSVKINGQRAYSLARKKEISLDDVSEREIEIYLIEILSYVCPILNVKIHCSGGTYIRSIARDLGHMLGTCAALSGLKRIKAGNYFNIEDSVTLDLLNKDTLSRYLLPTRDILPFERLYLDNNQKNDIACGKSINISSGNINQKFQMIDNKDSLIGIGQITNKNILKPLKVFIKREEQILCVK